MSALSSVYLLLFLSHLPSLCLLLSLYVCLLLRPLTVYSSLTLSVRYLVCSLIYLPVSNSSSLVCLLLCLLMRLFLQFVSLLLSLCLLYDQSVYCSTVC